MPRPTPDEQTALDALNKANLELFKTASEAALNHANLFILAGYGTFFALWSLTSDHLYSWTLALWAAFALLLSAAVFVLFQVWSVYEQSGSLTRFMRSLLEKPATSIDDFLKRYEEFGSAVTKRSLFLAKVWLPVFVFTVVTGFVGIVLLGFGIVQTLWVRPPSP